MKENWEKRGRLTLFGTKRVASQVFRGTGKPGQENDMNIITIDRLNRAMTKGKRKW